MHSTRAVTTIFAAALTAGVLAACGNGAGAGSAPTAEQTAAAAADNSGLVIYSGRNEKLVGPLLGKLEQAVGAPVQVRYGDTAAMAAQILEEGDNSPADLFFGQDAGALGALAKQNRLAALDAQTTGQVIDGYADENNLWVATSARARVIAYNPATAPEIANATSIDVVLEPKYKGGKIGYAPTNASWQSFVTALRVTKGEDGARDWLTKFKAQEPRAYERNGGVLEGVESGEVDLGLINHYYWYAKVAEEGDAVKSKIRFLDSEDPGALINVAGVGVVAGTDQSEAANKAVNFLLSKEAQTYFADETAEYPVIEGVTSKHDLPDLSTLKKPAIDLNDLDSLPQTLELLGQVGLT
ncbi:iron(III) transport system substrate-binding protein [Kineosphaera limosa]|uniref:Putative iron(III) ABC transporter substrate-binding protein n=1 Tax=Kineosphaera limosa NBRC 100340 TaxID=1184609 RepID=K6X7Z1_9MICO|nr:extracellular solute-binding protein [Kineosphaera limosa]NYE00885.1 iron(III) transport system substrate-binding protein [Kineosphaera limosa]GAB94919.1 putative iron(III) ABC transporter substrate-binding protein [Kineosphaera limosa NBRC 100340]